ncbi:MAG: hypothetical protein IKP74_00255, partial [Clostridia bacterium]|nr:hypothetical protein [Clostridia bacterium]
IANAKLKNRIAFFMGLSFADKSPLPSMIIGFLSVFCRSDGGRHADVSRPVATLAGRYALLLASPFVPV